MSWSLRTKLGLGIGAALTILAAVDLVSNSQLTGLIRVASSLSNTYEVLDELDAVLLHLQNAETGQRGYLLTGEVSYLEPYQAAVRSIDSDIEKLRRNLAEEERPKHGGRFEVLRGLVDAKLAELDETITIRREEGFDAARRLVLTDRGKAIMDDVRVVIDEMRAEEMLALNAQREAVEESARATIRTIGAGSILGLVLLLAAGAIIHRDVAARQRAQEDQARLEASLRHSETMSAMGSLVAGVAHEVRNPLFGISSALEAMEARFGEREEYRNYLRVLRTELDRLARLMQRLLDYGKPPDQAFTPADARSAVLEAVRALELPAKAAGLQVRVNVAPGLPALAVDEDRLVQVLQHVLENAVQHSPAAGTVSIEAREVRDLGGASVEVAVSDAGPGFGPEELQLAFEPFFTRRRGGSGLGLAIVQRIVEGYRGRISIVNRAEGGATVLVALPTAWTETMESRRTQPGATETNSGRRRRGQHPLYDSRLSRDSGV